ncbi:MAG: 30S ribosomal protein S18 [Defluviitaleaceae bacterium]|nr:30S ribosomal protein S18 [Defluviitaleaceae bacterium]
MIQKRRGRRKKRVCTFCADKITAIDYKEIGKLRKFVSERGKILPRRVTGNCAKHQRAMTMNVKRARHMALMAFTAE